MTSSLQIALDFLDLDAAVDLGRTVANLAERIEAGTPLIKRYGMRALATLRAALPDHCLVADLKTMDAGAFEANLALDAGADVLTVLAVAGDNTIGAMAEAAHARQATVMADLMGCKKPEMDLPRLVALGVDAVCLHLAADDQAAGSDPFARLVDLRRAAAALPHAPALAVAGGIDAARLAHLCALPDIVIVGSAVTAARDPRGAARAIRDAIRTHGGVGA